MRFYKQRNNIKLVRRFLWLPLTIGDETRWLEVATVVFLNERALRWGSE